MCFRIPRPKLARALSVAATLVCAIAPGVPAAEFSLAGESALRRLPPPGSDAWQPLTFPKVDRHTLYEAAADPSAPGTGTSGGEHRSGVLRAQSECSASGRVLQLGKHVKLHETPRLRWSWRVEHGLEIPDERIRAGDDFAARVYALFDFQPQDSSLWRRARRSLAVALYGEGLPGKAISYVWASRAAPGSSWENPYSSDTTMVVLRSGEHSGWQTQTVDLAADHIRLLGGSHASLMGIALMSDSDDSCQRAVAYFSDFELLP